MVGAGQEVLEPMMSVEVNVDKSIYQGVMAGILKRKGSITKTETKGDYPYKYESDLVSSGLMAAGIAKTGNYFLGLNASAYDVNATGKSTSTQFDQLCSLLD